MNNTLHITSGDCAGNILAKSRISGEVFVWHDILYDGPRNPGWPDDNTLITRAKFLEKATAGGLDQKYILSTFKNQYRKLASAGEYKHIVLWFDACLFDQSMLVHILTCLRHQGIRKVELICVDHFPGIEPFHGLGQLNPSQMASVYDQRHAVTSKQFKFAKVVDAAFASCDIKLLTEISHEKTAPLPWIPAAITRYVQEQPDPKSGLGRLETLALDAIRGGCETPGEIFTTVANADTIPQYWGDTTLWAKINALADHCPPLVVIEGPATRLPQWESKLNLQSFRIKGP
jgi:Domain of unknown function (DUF1835)